MDADPPVAEEPFPFVMDFRLLHAFCSRCGVPLKPGSHAGREHAFCPGCGYVCKHYPAVGVAAVVRDAEGRVLMGRRAHGRYAGLWCIPCGYVEWGEDVRDAARRELREETGLEASVGPVIAVHSNFHNPEQLTVGIWFGADVRGGVLHPADGENTELAYFDPAVPPPLAFATDALVLQQLASDRSDPSG